MISIIAAVDENRVIGSKGALPWRYSEDLKYFKKVTLNHPCVMGRKTYESILNVLKEPLPQRKNIVVSRQKLNDEGITVIHDLEYFLENNQDTDEEIFVIGGETIFNIALPYAKRIYLTHIHATYDGDTYFPNVDYSKYLRIYYDNREDLSFAIYERK